MGQLLEGAILCTIDVIGLYFNIPHEEELTSLRTFLDVRMEKKVTIETLVEFAEIILKNIFQFNEKKLKQLRDTVFGTKCTPPYVILFMVETLNAF